MASSGYCTNMYPSGVYINNILLSINVFQTNFDPQNESFDLNYNIKIIHLRASDIYIVRDVKLTLNYIMDDKTVSILKNKIVNATQTWTTVATGTITVKTEKTNDILIPLCMDCIATYQRGISVVGTTTWNEYYNSSLKYTFNLDGFKSPIITNAKSDITIYEDKCDTVLFNIKENYSDLKYKITVNFKSFSEIILNNKSLTDNQIQFTPPISWLDYMPNETKSSEAYIEVTTYNNNNKQIGTSSYTYLNVSISEELKPIITNFILEKISDFVPENYDLLIQGLSKAKIKFNYTPCRGAEISKYYLSSSSGDISNSNEITTNILTNPGNVEFTAYIIDSRGRKSDIKIYNIFVEKYNKPIITEYFAKRCNSLGEYRDDGNYVIAKLNGSCYSLDGKNNITNLKIKVKENIGDNVICDDSVLADTETILSGQYSPEHSYTVTFSITDCFFTSQINLLVSTSKATLDLLKGGKGIAFGKVAETEGFECEYDAKFNNNIYFIVNGLQKELRTVLEELNETKLSLNKIIKSTNITEDGYLMDGRVISEEFTKINNDILDFSNNNINDYIIEFGSGSLTTTVKEVEEQTVSVGKITISLSKQFTYTPYIYLTCKEDPYFSRIYPLNITTSSFDVCAVHTINSLSATINFNWLAIGR